MAYVLKQVEPSLELFSAELARDEVPESALSTLEEVRGGCSGEAA